MRQITKIILVHDLFEQEVSKTRIAVAHDFMLNIVTKYRFFIHYLVPIFEFIKDLSYPNK